MISKKCFCVHDVGCQWELWRCPRGSGCVAWAQVNVVVPLMTVRTGLKVLSWILKEAAAAAGVVLATGDHCGH